MMNSVLMRARAGLKEWSHRKGEISIRAEQFKTQGQEEIKSQGAREIFKRKALSVEEEVEIMKKRSETLRDYDWKEELDLVHRILHNTISLLLTNSED